jgi:hypothetical protein
MNKKFGGLGDDMIAGGRDQGIGPTGPDMDRAEGSRKGSDMSGATSPDPRGNRDAQPAEEGAHVDETPSRDQARASRETNAASRSLGLYASTSDTDE